MIIENGFTERDDIYTFSKEDKIKIESQYGITKIYINDKPLKFITKLELVHEQDKMPELKTRKIITLEEIQETIKNLQKTKEEQ